MVQAAVTDDEVCASGRLSVDDANDIHTVGGDDEAPKLNEHSAADTG
jgi:hypothetical protein